MYKKNNNYIVIVSIESSTIGSGSVFWKPFSGSLSSNSTNFNTSSIVVIPWTALIKPSCNRVYVSSSL